jgi:hypothetical protein
MDASIFSDPPYDIISANRKIFKSIYKCLQRVLKRKDFATIFDIFHAEYFRARLLFHNIHVPVCTLQEDVTMFKVSMYTVKGNPLLHRFNEIITRMFEAGFNVKWQNDFLSNSRLDDHPSDDDDDDTNFSDFATNELIADYTSFSLIHSQDVPHLLLTGQIFNIFIYLVEVLYYRPCITVAASTKLYSPQRDH